MKTMNRMVNVAVQVLPEGGGSTSYALVDEAIRVIAESGYTYRVCPFETVVECTLEEAMALIAGIHQAVESAGADRMLTYVKIQSDFSGDVAISDKMRKYDKF